MGSGLTLARVPPVVWILHEDHAAVTLECSAEGVETVSLPGAFLPENSSREIAVPLYQGVLIQGRGTTWRRTVEHGGHSQFSMAMAATLAKNGALLLTHDSPANWLATYGEMKDPPVQKAIRAALPVAGLHRRIGPCEMTSFAFLSEDRTIQATTFSDGTRIVANLSDQPREVAGHGILPPCAWRDEGR